MDRDDDRIFFYCYSAKLKQQFSDKKNTSKPFMKTTLVDTLRIDVPADKKRNGFTQLWNRLGSKNLQMKQNTLLT